MEHLLRIDTSGIKRFVDNRRHFPEMKMASKLIQSGLNSVVETIENYYGTESYTMLYNGGGNALIQVDEFPAENNIIRWQENFKNKIVTTLQRSLDELPLNSIHHPNLPSIIIDVSKISGSILDTRIQLTQKMATTKRTVHDTISKTKPFSGLNHNNTCHSCFQAKAEFKRIENDDSETLCYLCKAMVNGGLTIIGDLAKKYDFTDYLGIIKEYQLEFISGLTIKELKTNYDTANRNSKSRLAVAFIDGNLFSYQLSKLENIENFVDVSKAIENQISGQYENIILKVEEKISKELAFQLDLGTIYIGGDDMRLLLPSKYWYPVVREVITSFHNEMKDKFSNSSWKLSAGIAISKPKTNLENLFKQAEWLLNEAKKNLTDQIGSLDFHYSTTETVLDALKTQRKFLENQGFYMGAYPLKSKYLKRLHNLFDEKIYGKFEKILPIRKENLIKSRYLNPWQNVMAYIESEDIENRLLGSILYSYNRSQKLRNDDSAFGYKSVKEFYDISDFDNNQGIKSHLPRMLDIVQLRCGL